MKPGATSESAIWSAVAPVDPGVGGADPAPSDLGFVLVHGSLDRSAGLLKLSRRLTDVGPVVRYDRRGYGKSTPHDGPFAVSDQVADLVTVLDRHGERARRWVLVGHSYGGNVALASVGRADVPAEVLAAVVYEPPLSWLPWWPHETAGGSAVEMVRTHGPDVAADAAEAFMRTLIGDERWERLPPGVRAARRGEGVAMVAELVALRRSAPWQPFAIDVPVLALAGGASREHHRRAVDEVASMIDGAERATIDDAGHFGPNTHPDVTAATIAAFLTRRRVRGR